MGLGVAAGTGASVGAFLSCAFHFFSTQLEQRVSVTRLQAAWAVRPRPLDDYCIAVLLVAFSVWSTVGWPLLLMKQIVLCLLASMLKLARATSPAGGSSSRESSCP